MNLYELVNLSDPIVFYAESDSVACCCTLLLGNGQLMFKREDGKEPDPAAPVLLLIPKNEMCDFITKLFGCTLDDFITQNMSAIRDCFLSFSYGDFCSRREYDMAISAITDQDKLNEFKSFHEDQMRTSMNQWVTHAWYYGKKFNNLINGESTKNERNN